MSRYISRGGLRFLVAAVAPHARLAREDRLIAEVSRESNRVQREAEAEFKRQQAPTPLAAAVAKAKEDVRLAKEKDAFVLKAQTDVFVSGTELRERKEEVARAIRKSNKSSSEMVADMQRQERKSNE